MDKKSKVLLSVFIVAVFISVLATYNRIYIQRNYQIIAEVDCDPEIDSCFIWEDEEGTWYYNLIEKRASNIPICNPHREICEDFFYCEEGEEDCFETFCDPEDLEEGESCAGPGLILGVDEMMEDVVYTGGVIE